MPKADFDPSSGGTRLAVLAVADGYGMAWAISAKPGEEITLRLVKDVPIAGRVLDTEGRPVANARVRVWAVAARQSGSLDPFLETWQTNWNFAWSGVRLRFFLSTQIMSVTTTDRDGRFRLAGVGGDRLAGVTVTGPTIARETILIVARDGFDPRPYNRAAAGRAAGMPSRPGETPVLYGPTFDLVAAPGKTISGVVREAGGEPVAGVWLVTDAGWFGTPAAVTDAQGRFHLTGLPKQATYRLTVTPDPKGSMLVRWVSVADTEGLQPMTADVRLSRGIVVQGRVTDRQTGQGVHGRVSFFALPENPYVNKPGYEMLTYGGIGRESDLDGRFCLTVSPGPGVLAFEAYGSEAIGRRGPVPYLQAHFDEEDGKHVKVMGSGEIDRFFAIAGAERSLYLRQFHAAKWINLADGADPITRDFVLDRGRTATVRIQDPDGRPLTGAVVGSAVPPWLAKSLEGAEHTLQMLDPEDAPAVRVLSPGPEARRSPVSGGHGTGAGDGQADAHGNCHRPRFGSGGAAYGRVVCPDAVSCRSRPATEL
jgi:protocatechuate 3,4-dioxygenase beta subunit